MTQEIITGATDAWLSNKWKTVGDIKLAATNGNPDGAVGEMHYSATDMSKYEGWVKIGKAVITVTLDDDSEIMTAQVEALKQELKIARADAFLREKLISDRLNNLLALTLSPTTKEI